MENYKVLYYRDYEKKGKRIDGRKNIYVCLIIDGQKILSRGVSVCSKKDRLVKAVGRNLARIRAEKAIENERNIGSLNRGGFHFVGYYLPDSTDKEKQILAKEKVAIVT